MNSKNDSLSEAMLDALEEEQIVSALDVYAEEEGAALLRQNEELSKLLEYQLLSKTKRRFRRILRRNIPVQKRYVRRAVLLIAALLTALLLTCTALGENLFDFILREFTGYASVSNDFSNSACTNHYCVWGDTLSPAYLPSVINIPHMKTLVRHPSQSIWIMQGTSSFFLSSQAHPSS